MRGYPVFVMVVKRVWPGGAKAGVEGAVSPFVVKPCDRVSAASAPARRRSGSLGRRLLTRLRT